MLSFPKANVCRSDAYRRLVAQLPCIHCGRSGNSQAAHADEGKGAHYKSDDRTCMPLCAVRYGSAGCHALLGASGAYSRDERRALERDYGARTRRHIRESGKWPAGLPHMEEPEHMETES